MPPVPTTRKGLIPPVNGAGNCRACDAKIEWWRTPGGANIPMHVVVVEGCEQVIVHFVDCKARQAFRRANAVGRKPKPKTGNLFE